jgi:two-component sensor histidine kinase
VNKKQEEILEQSNKRIRKQRDEIETLLKEIHHRIKNNLQIVTSLLSLEMNQFEDLKFKKAFQDSKNRINSIATLHELFYSSGDFASVNIKDYLDSVIRNIESSYNLEKFKISTAIDESGFNSKDSVLLGLIISEIITNSIKHAGALNSNLGIYVNLKTVKSKHIFEIGDHGPGLDSSDSKNETLGLELISLLSEQMSGNLSIVKKDMGLHYKLILGL